MKTIHFLLLLVLCLACETDQVKTKQSPRLTSNAQPPYATKIDQLFKDFATNNSPGYAIGITKGDQVLYSKGYGLANLEYDIPLSTKSVFSIASVSKQFTGACIALLLQEGKLSLNDDAATFIPELNKYPETIQIKHLIYNTSGLVDYHRLPRATGKSWITFNYFDIDEAIQTSLAQEQLSFKPGEKWDYCNVNFMLLTKIVEQVSGMPFREFITKRLFQPLQMHDSRINDDITQIVKNRVIPYNYRTSETIDSYRDYGIQLNPEGAFVQHPRTSPHYGGSGVMTTVEDLMRWAINFHTKEVGGEPFYRLMQQTMKFAHDRDNQALGLYIGDFNGRKIVAWDGGDWGISSQLMRFPEEGIAIICLSNLGSGEAFRKVNQIADILIEAGEM